MAGPRRGASPAPLPRQRPAAGTKSLVLIRPAHAPRSRPVNPGAQAPGTGKGTGAWGKPTVAPRATRPDETRRTNAGLRGTPGRHAAGHNQVPSNNSHRVQRIWAARTTAQEQVPGNTQPTHHKPKIGMAGYKQRVHTDTHTATSKPTMAGRSRRPSPSTHTHAAHPSQEWRGTRGARTQTLTDPNTPARSGGAQPQPEPKHTQQHRTP